MLIKQDNLIDIDIYKTKYPNIEEFSNTIIPIFTDCLTDEHNYFSQMADGGICCMIMTDNQTINAMLPQSIPWIDWLTPIFNFVSIHANNYIKLTNPSVVSLAAKVKSAWVSYYPNNAYFDYHNHHRQQVAVLYLQKKENAGNFWIKNSDNTEVEIITEEGDLLIFPGDLDHRTTPNLSNTLRVVLAFDIVYYETSNV